MTEQDEELYYFHNIMKDLFDGGGNQIELDTLFTVLMSGPNIFNHNGYKVEVSEEDKQYFLSIFESLGNLDYEIDKWAYTSPALFEKEPRILLDVSNKSNSDVYYIGFYIDDIVDILLDYRLDGEDISTCFKRIHCALTDPNFPKPFFGNMAHWDSLKRKTAAL